MKPEAAARQVAQEKAAQQKLMELMWQRLGKELSIEGFEDLDLATKWDAMSSEKLLEMIFMGMIGK